MTSQIALAAALLVGAGLLARSFAAPMRVDPGFTTERALTLETMVGRGRTPEQSAALIEQMQQRVSSLPGVRAAAVSSALPFHDNQVTIPWPQEDPIGKKVTFTAFGQEATCEVVGVIGDARPAGFDSEPRPEIYQPYAQSPARLVTWVVRTAGDPSAQLNAVKEKIREANPAQTFLSIATLEQLADRTISRRRFNLLLFGTFAILALALAGRCSSCLWRHLNSRPHLSDIKSA